MVLKGLPEEYRPFVVVVTQSDKEQKFSEFKVEKSPCDEDGIHEGIPVGGRVLSVRPTRAHCSLL